MDAAGSDLNASSGQVLVAGPLEVRLDQRTVLADGRVMVLTVREFHLLAVLASRPEQVVGRDEIYELVWGGPMPDQDRSVDVYVSKLRHKLEASLPHWSFVQTHIGFGYCFSPRPLVA
ncbi:MAG: response regulator transcription factor [Solirubrobacterales bacterium]|nr:response regulator transcription factor [Solirubrobacterales bacterium]